MNRIKTMDRRHTLLTLGAVATVAAPSWAQEAWKEGEHYTRLPQAVPGPVGKIEVVEFFAYSCPLCNAFEPALNAWVKRLSANVAFRHQHFLLREAIRPHHRLFFTLDAMGVESTFRAAIFEALHVQRLRLESLDDMLKLLQPKGLDVAKFRSTWAAFEPKAFSAARIENAQRQATQAYRINGVPTLAVGGRFLISPPEASGRRPENPVGAAALRLADQLLSTLRPS